MTKQYILPLLDTDQAVYFENQDQMQSWLHTLGLRPKSSWYYNGVYTHNHRVKCEIVGRVQCSTTPVQAKNGEWLTPQGYNRVAIIALPEGLLPIVIDCIT